MENVTIRKKKMKGKSGLKQAFEFATSSSEMLKIFNKMESKFQEKELSFECYRLALQLNQENQDPQKILSFGKRALKIAIDWHQNVTNRNDFNTQTHSTSFFLANVLHLLGLSCFKLNMLDESLCYLNWSDRNLSKLDKGSSNPIPVDVFLSSLVATQFELFRVKIALGKREECVLHGRKVLEIKEKLLEQGSFELGEANHDVSDAYVEVMELEEALPFALKALDIYTKHGLGDESMGVAQVRRNLGIIYGGLGEHEKALELTRLSLKGLKSVECRSDWINAEMEVGSRLIVLGRNEEGIKALESLLSLAETKGMHQVRAFVFTAMARGCCNLGKFTDAKKYMKIAQRIVEKNALVPAVVAAALEDMSTLYEEMKEYELAISYLRRAMTIPELPQKQLVDVSLRLFLLISRTENYKKGITYLEEVVEILKEKFGPENCHVGRVYTNLGVSYWRLGEPETAAKYFVLARDILDVSLGPDHLDSLATSQTLAITYASMNSYKKAVEVQENVVECWKRVGPSQQKYQDAAVRALKDMKERAVGEDLPEKISKCGVSEDGK